MKIFNNSFVKYGVIGLVNTIIGYGLIFTFMYLGILAEISNFLGYFVGFFVSYSLNKKYNFKSQNSHKRDLPKFLISMSIAYIFNLLTLIACYRFFGLNSYLSQIIAGAIYTLSGYILSKIWVFNYKENV